MAELYGYARVSTKDQKLDVQIDALKEAGCSRVFVDVVSGKNGARPELLRCFDMLRGGDTLVVWRLDRLGRSLWDLQASMRELEKRNIAFLSLTEKIDTSTSMGKLFFQMTGAIAEFERNLIVERTNAGLKSARRRGRKGGRPSKVTATARKQMWALYQSEEIPLMEICNQYGISKPTFYLRVRDHYVKEKGHE